MANLQPCLVCISEIFQPLQYHFAPLHLLICVPEPNRQPTGAKQDTNVASNGRIDSWKVSGLILAPKDQGAGDSADTTKTDQCGTAECAFPVPANIVSLIRQHGGRVPTGSRHDEEDTRVSNGIRMVECHEHQPNERENRVEGYNGASQTIPVPEPSLCVHDQTCKDPRRHDETLRFCDRET